MKLYPTNGQVKVGLINPVSITQCKLCWAVMSVQAVEKWWYQRHGSTLIRRLFWATFAANPGNFTCAWGIRCKPFKRSQPPLGTRGLHPKEIAESTWPHIAKLLCSAKQVNSSSSEEVIVSADDADKRKELTPLKTSTMSPKALTHGRERFKRYSSLCSLGTSLPSW